MSRFSDRVPVTVPIGPCGCPGTPHEQDEVYLRPTISLDGGMAAQAAIMRHGADAEALAKAWTPLFLRDGVTGWNLVDADGNPEPLDLDGLLTDFDAVRPVADKAAELYADSVLRPLLAASKQTSPDGRGARSTSAPRTSTRSRRKPSSPLALVASTR